MNDQHPAIVIGEPIPEVEPRIDLDRLDAMRKANRILRWTVGVFVIVSLTAMMMDIGFVGRLVFLTVVLGVIVVLGIRSKSWRAAGIAARGNNWLTKEGRQGGEWGIPLRISLEYYALFFALMMSVQSLMFIDGRLSAIGSYFGFFVVYGGIGLLFVAGYGREPGPISCRECSYPLVGLTLPCMCPECGVSLLDASRTTDRPRVRSAWFVPVGVVLIVMGGLMSYMSFAKPSLMYQTLPGGVLRNLAITDRDALEELMKNPMTAEETSGFIDSLIEQHETDELGYRQGKWLGDQFAVGGFSQDQIDRLMRFVPEIAIDAPERVRVGDSVEISLRSVEPDRPSGSFYLYYFFAGFRVDDDPVGYSSSDHFKRWKYLHEELFRSPGIEEDPSNRPFHVLEFSETGNVRIRARVAVVVGDPRALMGFLWDESMEPMFSVPPGWYRIVDLEHSIEVVEE